MQHRLSPLLVLLLTITGALSCSKKEKEGTNNKKGKAAPKEKGATKSKKWELEDYKRLTALQLPGFTLATKNSSKMGAINVYNGKNGPSGFFPQVRVVMKQCFGCAYQKMDDPTAWKKSFPKATTPVSKDKGDPNSLQELRSMDLGGIKVMTLYTKHFKKEGKTTTSKHSLVVFYNNKVNQVEITIYPTSKPHKFISSLKELEEALPKSKMIQVATTVLKTVVKEM